MLYSSHCRSEELALTYFLNHSNEDQVDAEIIAQQLLTLFDGRDSIEWFDIGCGPLHKLELIASIFKDSQGPAIILKAIDTSPYWCNFVKVKEKAITNNIIKQCNVECQEWGKSKEPKKALLKYDVISFMHATYSMRVREGIIPAVKRTADFLQDDGVLIIVVESPDSDLFFLRNTFLTSGEEANHYKIIENTLTKMGIPWSFVNAQPQEFLFEIKEFAFLRNSSEFSFITYIIEENCHKKLNQRELKILEYHILQRIKKNNGKYFLSTPDRIYFANTKEKKFKSEGEIGMRSKEKHKYKEVKNVQR